MKYRDQTNADQMSSHSSASGRGGMGQMSLFDILSVIWRRKAFMIGGAVVGVLLMLLFTATIAPKFVSQSSVLVDLRRLEVAKNGLIPNVPPSVLTTLVNSERSLLTSNSVLLQVVDKNDLHMDSEFGGSSGVGMLIGALKNAVGLGGSGATDRRLAAAAKLRKALSVVRKKDTVVLTVSLSSDNPEKSQKLTKSLIETYLAEREQSAQASVQRVVQTLESQLNGQAQAVAQAEDAVESYKIRNNIQDINGQLNSDQQVATVTNQLNAAQLDTNRAKSRYEQVRDLIRLGKVEAAGSSLFQSELITDLRTRLSQARDQRSILQATLQSGHPSMIEINTRITSLKNALQLEAQDVLKVIEQDLKRARTVEANLKQELAQLQQQSGSLKKSLVPLRELERKAEAARSVYVATLTRIREINAQQGVDDSNVRVISDPTLPLQNQRISRKLLVFMGATIGASIGAFVGFFTAFSAGGRVRKPEALHKMTGLSVLGQMPDVTADKQGKSGLFDRGAKAGLVDLSSLAGDKAGSENALLSIYSHLRKPYEMSKNGENEPDIVLVLGVGLDGKTQPLSANFAALAHGDGEYVLYIDGGREPNEGLMHYLIDGSERAASSRMGGASKSSRQGRSGASRASLRAIDKIDYLNIEEQGGARRTALQDLALRLDEHIDDYDFAVLDGGNLFEQPALNVLSYFANHIVLVVQEKTTDFDAMDRAYQILGEARDKVVGCLYIENGGNRNKGQRILEESDLPLAMAPWSRDYRANVSSLGAARRGKRVVS